MDFISYINSLPAAKREKAEKICADIFNSGWEDLSVPVKFDDCREVISCDETYAQIANDLWDCFSCVIGWTDEDRVTHHDICFCRPMAWHGTLQGIHPAAQRPLGVLFVSILRVGAFGFVVDESVLHANYVAEKLNIGAGKTSAEIAALINGVKRALAELKNAKTERPETVPEA